MCSSYSAYARPLAAYLSAIVLAAMIWLDASSAIAGSAPAATTLPPLPTPLVRSTPKSSLEQQRPRTLYRAGPKMRFGEADEIATLDAIQTALSSVADGGAFVWERDHGLLSGLIRPTTSFLSSSGKVCRHIVVRLNAQSYSREVEGVACRDASGTWSLAG